MVLLKNSLTQRYSIFKFENSTLRSVVTNTARSWKLIFSFKARRGLQRQNVCRQNSGVWLRAVLVNFGFSKNQHMGFSFSVIFCSKKIVWLGAVFVSMKFDSAQCYSAWSPTPRSVSQHGGRLHAVLVSAESLISRISPQKRIFQHNHFSLFIWGPGEFDSWKKMQKISWHCYFRVMLIRFISLNS